MFLWTEDTYVAFVHFICSEYTDTSRLNFQFNIVTALWLMCGLGKAHKTLGYGSLKVPLKEYHKCAYM